jgi:hypothetical protein
MAIRNVLEDARPRTEERSGYLFEEGMQPENVEARARRRAEAKLCLEQTLGRVFGGNEWHRISGADADERAQQCADLFREITGARWGTHIRMMDNGRIRYFLLHLTNHDAGRDLMKECIWKACPQGGFYASKWDDPKQMVLVERQPNLKPLYEWVRQRLSSGPKRWQQLAEDLREELWLQKHLNTVIHEMRNEGDIAAEAFQGKFAQTNDPLLRVRPKQMTLF